VSIIIPSPLLFVFSYAFENRIRFAPPLVISEEDLAEAVKTIGNCLLDFDVLDEIPGEKPVEKGHKDA
jgi:ornithine--oxo-acid transaminase